ncbi:MAG: PorT family protein [Bacteroidales bacterium]|nr:PorT family protein [Bacteroidales bacterium]
MKKLSKVLFVLLLVFISAQTYAQKIGIQGGINLTTLVEKDDDINYADEFEYENKLGFNGGLTLEMGLGDLIAVEIGALVESRGTQITEGDDYIRLNLLYADVPVLLKVGPSFGPVKVFGAAGPYIGFGITGKTTIKYEGEKESEDIEWGNDEEESDFKRLDYGAKFGIGAEVSGVTFGAYYSLGLANLSPYTGDGYKIQHRALSLSVGYKF